MTLTLKSILRDEETHSITDRRRAIRYVVAEYRGSDGEDYRKSFEGKRGQSLVIPERGTHAEINKLKIQW